MATDGETRAIRAGKWLVAFIVPASALAIGTLHPQVLVVFALLAAIACGLLWFDAPSRLSTSSRWVLAVLVGLTAYTMFQALPLPAGAVDTIAPANGDIWARALRPLREDGPSLHPITVAPVATHIEALRGLLYVSIFLSTLRIASIENGSSFLERVVIASGCVVALVTLAHPAVHAQRVYGFYAPRDLYGYYGGRLGPLLNANHASAYLNVAALVAVGVGVSTRAPLARGLSLAAAAICGGTAVWVGSRGGMGSLAVGAVVVVAIALLRRKKEQKNSGRNVTLVLVGGALFATAALVGVATSDFAWGELGDHDVSKLSMARNALGLTSLTPLFGFGRGAFETVFPLVSKGTTYVAVTNPENIVAQWSTEWGAPISLAAAGALAWALRPKAVLAGSRASVGAWTAIAATVLHDLVDFHLEVPGVMVLVVTCVAIVVGRRALPRTRTRERDRSQRTMRVAAFSAAALTLVFIGIVLPDSRHTLYDDRADAGRMAADRTLSPDAFRSALRASMLRYPAEPFLALAGASRAQIMGEGSVVPWIGHALERYPRFGRAHLVLARSLAAGRRAQARLEYRLAWENDRGLRDIIAREAPRLVDGYESALEVASDGADGVAMLEHLAETLGERLPATSAQIDAEIVRRSPQSIGVQKRRVASSLSDVANAHPWCSDQSCAGEAIQAAEALVEREPEKCEPRLLLARVRIAAGDKTRALDDLASSIDTVAQRGECLQGLVELAIANGDPRRADAAMDRALRGGCGAPQECVKLYSWAASTEEARGNRVRAISFYKRANELAPESDRYLERAAVLAGEAGLFAEAMELYRQLAARHPEDPKWRARSDELKGKIQSRQFALPK